MKPSTVIPIRGEFENPRTFLLHIAGDDEIENFVIITERKDGTLGRAQIGMTRAAMAYASLVLADWAREDTDS